MAESLIAQTFDASRYRGFAPILDSLHQTITPILHFVMRIGELVVCDFRAKKANIFSVHRRSVDS